MLPRFCSPSDVINKNKFSKTTWMDEHPPDSKHHTPSKRLLKLGSNAQVTWTPMQPLLDLHPTCFLGCNLPKGEEVKTEKLNGPASNHSDEGIVIDPINQIPPLSSFESFPSTAGEFHSHFYTKGILYKTLVCVLAIKLAFYCRKKRFLYIW